MSALPNASGWHKKFSAFVTSEQPNEEGEWRGYCPIHEDPEESKTPSASYQFDEGKFFCFGGCGGMSLTRLWSVVREDAPEPSPAGRRVRPIGDAPSKRAKGSAPLPSDEDIRQWVETLLGSPSALKVMTGKRGLERETLEKFEIGWHGERYTIPVRDYDGVLQNVRRYNATARQPKDKMLNLTGHGEARLFLPHILKDQDEVVITEGEMDAIIGQQHGLPTMSHTAGASVWKTEWSPMFEGKTVFICYDVDDAGYAGARKVATSVSKFAAAVHIIKLPLTAKGSDLTDYLVDNGYSASDFRELMDKARETSTARRKVNKQDIEAKKVTLEASMSAEHGEQPLEIIATVAGKVQPAYLLPKTVNFSCDGEFGPKCGKCPMMTWGLSHTRTFQKDDEVLLEMIDSSKEKVDRTLAKAIGAPPACTRLEYEKTEQWNVEELVVLPSVDNRDEQVQTPITRRVYNVGEYATPVNATSRLVGVNTTDPRNGRGLFQAWECEQTKTNLDRFAMTPELKKELKVFQVKKGQTPLEKMRAIAEDMEANVTRIYGRPEMHMAYDAVWHSVMDFRFKGVALGKGWLELLVMGDTRTGKSEAAMRLCDHYNAGVLKSCEGATFAGLVGGAQQTGNSWMVTWGTIPLNDRRLVVLDEVSGIKDKGIIDQMSAVRSMGKAQIVKIISQETSARTRLIWISNPPDGRPIRTMSKGAIEAVQQLIPNPEDVARFDLAMSAASSDVDSAVINSDNPPQVKHRYTAAKSSALVSWAWSRKVDDIVWEDGVESYVLEVAEDMGHRYITEPPLVQAENVRVKVARVAVAIAARVFSTDDAGEQVVVKREHVAAAIELMDAIYGMKSFGYRLSSTKVLRDMERAEENKKPVRKYLLQHEDALHALLSCIGEDFRVRDFSDFAGMTSDEGQITVRELMKFRMVRRMKKGGIRMDPALVEVLQELEDAEADRQ